MFFFSDWGFGNYGYRPITFSIVMVGISGFWCFLWSKSAAEHHLAHTGHPAFICFTASTIIFKTLEPCIHPFLPGVDLVIYSLAANLGLRPADLIRVAIPVDPVELFYKPEGMRSSQSYGFFAFFPFWALMSKESGLLVPLIGLYYLQFENKAKQGKMRSLLILVLIPGSVRCGALRAFLARMPRLIPKADTCWAGITMRIWVNWAAQPVWERILKMRLKISWRFSLPIFDGQGKLSLIGTKLNSLVVVGCTFLLTPAGIGWEVDQNSSG